MNMPITAKIYLFIKALLTVASTGNTFQAVVPTLCTWKSDILFSFLGHPSIQQMISKCLCYKYCVCDTKLS